MTQNPEKFLEDLSGRYARPYFGAIHDMFVALVRQNRPLLESARDRLAEVTAATMGASEVLGAEIAIRAAAGAMNEMGTVMSADRSRMRRFQDDPPQTIIPRVTLQEALDDFVERTPATIRDAAERTAQNIARLYSEDRVAAFVRSAEDSVTRRVQDFISQAIRDGITEPQAGRLISMSVDQVRELSQPWSEAYSRMVFRTNVNTAVTAGRFRQTQDPDIRAVTPAFEYQTADDDDVRANHARFDGRIWRVDNQVWNRVAPPLGYNCRCQIAVMTLPQLRRMGRVRPDGSVIESSVPPGPAADDGFRHGGRPDLGITGAV